MALFCISGAVSETGMNIDIQDRRQYRHVRTASKRLKCRYMKGKSPGRDEGSGKNTTPSLL